MHAAPAVGEVDVWEISDPRQPGRAAEATSRSAPQHPFRTSRRGPLEVGLDVDNDAEPDVTFSADATAAAGLQINAYANNDGDGNVALVLQLPDGTVLPIPAN